MFRESLDAWNGAEEQVMMERTGRHSSDGVCTNKCTSEVQYPSITDVLILLPLQIDLLELRHQLKKQKN